MNLVAVVTLQDFSQVLNINMTKAKYPYSSNPVYYITHTFKCHYKAAYVYLKALQYCVY